MDATSLSARADRLAANATALAGGASAVGRRKRPAAERDDGGRVEAYSHLSNPPESLRIAQRLKKVKEEQASDGLKPKEQVFVDAVKASATSLADLHRSTFGAGSVDRRAVLEVTDLFREAFEKASDDA